MLLHTYATINFHTTGQFYTMITYIAKLQHTTLSPLLNGVYDSRGWVLNQLAKLQVGRYREQ